MVLFVIFSIVLSSGIPVYPGRKWCQGSEAVGGRTASSPDSSPEARLTADVLPGIVADSERQIDAQKAEKQTRP
jgi:hypothetical protein